MLQAAGAASDPAFLLSAKGFFMLDQLRQGAQSTFSKVLMVLLVISFGIWGTGTFQGYGQGTLATVGETEVSVQEFARLYDQAQRNAQQKGQPVNPEQVLGVLVTNAAMDDAAREYGLGVSGDRVAAEIAKNPSFQREDGTLDPNRLDAALNNARMKRDDFVHEIRRGLVRAQIADTIGAGLETPQPLVAALYRLQNEERTISSFVVDASSIEPVAAPSQSDLQAYFDENKEQFKAPEYRKLALLVLDPTEIADPDAVTAEAVAAEYEKRKASLTQPERRRIEQMRFATAEDASAAMKRIEGGEDFSAVATASGVELTDLGDKTKAEVLDPAIADAAFAAELDKPILVTEKALEPSIIRVTAIEPEKAPTLDEMSARIRQELATRAAREGAEDLYNQIEDERAGGATLEEAAAKLKLPYRVVEAVSADLQAPDGNVISDIPLAPQVITESFQSDVGVETSPARGESGTWVFFEVLEIIPVRDRTLDEVRDQVVTAWTAAETEKRISDLANSLFDRLKGGASLTSLAAEIGKPVQTVEKVTRIAPPATLPSNAAKQAFAGPEGHVANADGNGSERILLKVDKVFAPPFFAEATGVAAIKDQISEQLKNDLLATYNLQLRGTRSVSVNNAAFQQLTGQAQTQ